MEKDSLKYKSLKNASYNMFGYAWSIIFAIGITPIIVFKLGIKEYGIYIFINTLISLLGLIDLGITTAATKYIAEYHGAQEHSKLKSLIRSLNSIYLIIGAVGLLIFITAGLVGYHFFEAQIPDPSIYLPLFAIAGFIFFINSINSIYVLIPQALQRFDISTKIGLVHLTLSQVTLLILVMLGFGLPVLFLSQLIFTVLLSGVMLYVSKKIMPLAELSFGWDKVEIIKCYTFGLGATISATANSSLTYLDRLIIPLFMGPTALTFYTLPGSIAGKVPGITNNISAMIFPMTSSLSGTGEKESISKLYIRSFRLLTIFGTAMVTSIIFFSYEMMRYWLNEEFAVQSTSVLIVLALTNFILCLAGPLSSFLLGLGKVRFMIISSIVMAVLNIILLVTLLPHYGILGAAWAYLLSLLPVGYMMYHTEKHFLDLSNRARYYIVLSSKLLLTTAVAYIITNYGLLPFVHSFNAILFLGPLSVLIFLALYKVFGFYEDEDWNDLSRFTHLAFERLTFKKAENV